MNERDRAEIEDALEPFGVIGGIMLSFFLYQCIYGEWIDTTLAGRDADHFGTEKALTTVFMAFLIALSLTIQRRTRDDADDWSGFFTFNGLFVLISGFDLILSYIAVGSRNTFCLFLGFVFTWLARPSLISFRKSK